MLRKMRPTGYEEQLFGKEGSLELKRERCEKLASVGSDIARQEQAAAETLWGENSAEEHPNKVVRAFASNRLALTDSLSALCKAAKQRSGERPLPKTAEGYEDLALEISEVILKLRDSEVQWALELRKRQTSVGEKDLQCLLSKSRFLWTLER